MSALFKRQWRVLIGEQETLSTTSLRVAFKVTKTLEKEPNQADLKLSNLSEESRAKLNKKGMPVIIQAGYEGNLGTIFSGDSRTVDHVREGAGWTTHIQCGDGEQAYNYARMNESFGPGVAVETVIRKAAEALSLNQGNLSEALALGLKISTFKHGYTAFGPASQVLTKLLAAAGFQWSVQQGALQVYRPNEPIQTRAIRLSASTGLIGSPDHSAPDKKTKQIVLKVKALLNHQFLPGYIVSLDSEGAKGEFLMRKVEHTGDSHGNDWFSNLECVPRKL